MLSKRKVAIIGGGIFGCLTAIRLSKSGCSVSIYEKNSTLMAGASFNNQNRLHLGYHYPRDEKTALQCIQGFTKFKQEFQECILENFQNNYYIASTGSKITFNEYELFCNRVGLPFNKIKNKPLLPVHNVSGGISTREVVYDSQLLSLSVRRLLKENNVVIKCNHNITNVSKKGSSIFEIYVDKTLVGSFDNIINCSYTNYNKFNSDLGVDSNEIQFDYTFVPIIKWIDQPIGITIMDGPFMTILPFGKTGYFLLYHVEHSVIDRKISTNIDPSWLEKSTAPLSKISRKDLFEKMIIASAEFVPDIVNAKFLNALEGPRAVFANKHITDERPSLIECVDPDGFFSVFSGKIDHSIWVADAISEMILH